MRLISAIDLRAFNRAVKKNIRAFTLVEVLVAMLVLSIGLLGLAGITVVVLRSNMLSQQISEATTVASQLMDMLRSQDPSTYVNCEDAATEIQVPPTNGCSILTDSGISALSSVTNQYYPASTTTCSVPNVMTDGAVRMFDVVSRNLVMLQNPGGNICNISNNTLPNSSYVRYYRTSLNAAGVWDLIVVVLWKDRFGRWRNVHFSTTRAPAT